MDKVLAVKWIWKDQIKSVELIAFQDSMLQCGLWELHDIEDWIPGCADVPTGFTSVMLGECFEKIEQLDEKVVQHDLLVRRFLTLFDFRL